jgi:hypothetical protein
MLFWSLHETGSAARWVAAEVCLTPVMQFRPRTLPNRWFAEPLVPSSGIAVFLAERKEKHDL